MCILLLCNFSPTQFTYHFHLKQEAQLSSVLLFGHYWDAYHRSYTVTFNDSAEIPNECQLVLLLTDFIFANF